MLTFATYLAPELRDVYAFIAAYVGERLGTATRLVVGRGYRRLVSPEIDVAFVCSLACMSREPSRPCVLEPVAAPVLTGRRYRDRPVYFSDVIVRADSPLRSFADLRGRVWAYNERGSQSGYGIVRYAMLERGETCGFFGGVIRTGAHYRSIRMVLGGDVDASAIDSHVLAVELRDRPQVRDGLRVIDAFGPSTIQPVAVARRLPERLREDIRRALLQMGEDPKARPHLDRGLIRRFAQVTDESYDDVRSMVSACEAAGFMTIR